MSTKNNDVGFGTSPHSHFSFNWHDKISLVAQKIETSFENINLGPGVGWCLCIMCWTASSCQTIQFWFASLFFFVFKYRKNVVNFSRLNIWVDFIFIPRFRLMYFFRLCKEILANTWSVPNEVNMWWWKSDNIIHEILKLQERGL